MTQIFYFSGTGNSYYVAKKIAGQIDGCKINSIYDCLKNNIFSFDNDIIGIVFPVHAFTMPSMVRRFVEKLILKPNAYIFAVATRGGSPCRVFKHLDKLLKNKELKVNAPFFVNMPNNYLTMFKLPNAEKMAELERETQIKIGEIANIVREKQEIKLKDYGDPFERNVMFPILSFIFRKTGHFGLQRKFYADENCNLCGICHKLCLADKIDCTKGKPIWDKKVKCEFCFACIQNCPQKAIQLKNSKTKKRERYINPHISIIELITQKDIAEKKE